MKKVLNVFSNWGIRTITGIIAIALGAIAALWTQSDFEQYSVLAHMTAYVLLWVLWGLVAIKMIFVKEDD